MCTSRQQTRENHNFSAFGSRSRFANQTKDVQGAEKKFPFSLFYSVGRKMYEKEIYLSPHENNESPFAIFISAEDYINPCKYTMM